MVRRRGITMAYPPVSRIHHRHPHREPPTRSARAPVPADVVGRRAPGSLPLRIAGAWCGVYAGAWIALGTLVLAISANLDAVPAPGVGWGSMLFLVAAGSALACGVPAVVAWRAAAPERTLEGVVAFAIGIGVLGLVLFQVLLGAASATEWFGLDVWALRSGPFSAIPVVAVVPASLMVLGTVWRWSARRGGRSPWRRVAISVAALAAAALTVGGAVAAGTVRPSCPPARTCVPSMGISFDLPAGWSRADPDAGERYAASAGGTEHRFVIEDGAAVFRDQGATVPASLDDVRASVPELLAGNQGFGSTSGIEAEWVDLPAGPAIRVAYTRTTSFIFSSTQTNVTYWLFVDGKLVVLEYMTAFGEGSPDETATDPPDFSRLLASVRALGP